MSFHLNDDVNDRPELLRSTLQLLENISDLCNVHGSNALDRTFSTRWKNSLPRSLRGSLRSPQSSKRGLKLGREICKENRAIVLPLNEKHKTNK